MSIHKAYALEGVPYILGNNDVGVGVERINAYLKPLKWFITENCRMLISEMARLRWKIYENAKKRHENNARPEIHKYRDHAPDAARYFFGLMPDLRLPDPTGKIDKNQINRMVQEALGATVYRPGKVIDWNLQRELQQPMSDEWTIVDL